MTQNLQQNRSFVENVFSTVFERYDVMNDLMSFGMHRIWKQRLLNIMRPSNDQSLIDVGCGTGDICELFSKHTSNETKILAVDPNINMIEKCKKRLGHLKNLELKICNGEELKVKDNSFDFYTISFGLRNTADIEKTISEAYRVLRKGGRFFCLEFSKIDNENLDFIYKQYSRIIPSIGKYVVGDSKPYEYLIKSIENSVNQEELLEVLKSKNFKNCNYVNLNGGIVAIHYGWKI